MGAEGAARLTARFLDDTLETVQLARAEVSLWAASGADASALAKSHIRYKTYVQTQGDLGARMADAMRRLLARHARVLLIGADAPTLPRALVQAAADALAPAAEPTDAVFIPAADGGYVLVGVRARPLDLEGGPIRWSTRHALADTLARAEGRRLRVLRPWYDVDTPEDLRLLRTHLAVDPRAAPRTAALLSASGGRFER